MDKWTLRKSFCVGLLWEKESGQRINQAATYHVHKLMAVIELTLYPSHTKGSNEVRAEQCVTFSSCWRVLTTKLFEEVSRLKNER